MGSVEKCSICETNRKTWDLFRASRPHICDKCWVGLKYHALELIWYLRDDRLFEDLISSRVSRRKKEMDKSTKLIIKASIHDKISELEDLANVIRAIQV